MRVAGVHIKGGKVHLACIEADTHCAHLPDAPARLEFNMGLAEADQLADLKDRIRQDLSAARVERVGLVQTRSHSNWKYKDAYTRVLAISAVMAASTELNIPFETVKTSAIGRTVGLAADKLGTIAPSEFGFEGAPKYWTTGLADAFAAAAHLVRVETGSS